MKRIGIIGGMSYESTLHYYERINRQVNEAAGGLCSADLVLRSVNFEKYHNLMEKGDWKTIQDNLRGEAMRLVHYDGCRYVAIATNTMHKIVDGSFAEIPLVDIRDCVAEQCKAAGVESVAILGTKFTMTEGFMKSRLEKNGLKVVGEPTERAVEQIDHIIFDELCHGKVYPASKQYLRDYCKDLARMKHIGSEPEGIILGCTELEMILDDECARWLLDEFGIKLFDTTQAHIDKLAQLCLS